MTQALGFKSQIALIFETNFGVTPETPAGLLMPVISEGLKGGRKLNDSKVNRNNRNPVRPTRGNMEVSGSVKVPLDYIGIGYWLKCLLGAPTTTDISTKGTLTGGSSATSVVATWTAVNNGEFAITINGASQNITGINFTTGVTTMADVAAKIQTALRAVGTGGFALATCVWSTNKFVIQSGIAGDSSIVTVLSAVSGGTGTDISGVGTTFMDAETGRGTVVNGVTKYQHVYKVPDTQPSFQLERANTDITSYTLYKGCKLSKFGVDFGGEGEIEVSLDIMGADKLVSGSPADAELTTFVLTEYDQFNAGIKEGGSASAIITKMSLSIDSGIEKQDAPLGNNGVIDRLNEGLMVASGNITAFFENQDLLSKAVNGTESSLELTLTGSGVNSLAFLIPELIYEESDPGTEGPSGIMIDLPYKAYYSNSSEASGIQATLVNTIASYA